MSTLASAASFSGRLGRSAQGDLPATSALPTPYRLADLLRAADETAEDFLSGRFDHLVPAAGRFPNDERWSHRLYADDDLDLWLISWVPGQSTVLHDHGGSLGALTVLSGALRERRWTGSDLRERILRAGDQAAFPLGWVHDVERAPGDATNLGPMDPTLSVHAYSPPLTAMSYYEPTGRGPLRRTHTELTTAGDDGLRISAR
jgi:hypothetical protein